MNFMVFNINGQITSKEFELVYGYGSCIVGCLFIVLACSFNYRHFPTSCIKVYSFSSVPTWLADGLSIFIF